MASIIRDPNGQKRIAFSLKDGKRRTFRLGHVDTRAAEAVRGRIEVLVTASITGIEPDTETARWLASIGHRLHEKLAKAGLVPKKEVTGTTLGALLNTYFNNLAVKSGTETCYKQARRSLEDHFGTDKPLKSITPLAAEQWRQSLKSEGLAEATISKRVKVARQAFKRGQKWGMVVLNPFSEVKAGVQSNRARMFFVTREMAERVLEVAPDAEWRVLFALARYGGLRTPSESLTLRWRDVDWERGRLTVWSPKTSGYEGREFRHVPLFPELKAHLLDLFEQADPGAEFIITRYRDTSCNLRTQLLRLIARAGLQPWPKVWQNLRSSRQTELAEQYPLHVACAWIGNSVVVAQRHYVQLTDEHFAKAVAGNSSIKPAQKAAQHDAEPTGTNLHRQQREVA